MALKQGDLKIAIDRIANQHGGKITPRDVVDAVREAGPSHALYAEFDWDDQSAADKHRIAVAAALLRRIEYVGKDVEGREVTAVGYVYDQPTKTHVQLSAVARNKKQSHELMMQELRQCEAHIRRAQRICDVLHLRDKFDDLLRAVIDAQETAERETARPRRKQARAA